MFVSSWVSFQGDFVYLLSMVTIILIVAAVILAVGILALRNIIKIKRRP
jgi:hypothetical protein